MQGGVAGASSGTGQSSASGRTSFTRLTRLTRPITPRGVGAAGISSGPMTPETSVLQL